MKINSKHIIALICCLLFLCLILACTYVFESIREEIRMKREGNILIQYVDTFKVKYNRLPDNFELEVFENEHGNGPFYERNDTSYVVYYCLGFDNYYIYNYSTRKWNYSPQRREIQNITITESAH